MKYKTRLDEDDGWGRIVRLCREYTFSRAHSESRVFAAILGGTFIGPVIKVQIVKIVGQRGRDFIPSTLKHETTLLCSDYQRNGARSG